jgi:bacterial/archaeal transporter family protein
MFTDWRFLIFLYLALTGVWGILAKISASRLNPFTATFIAVSSCWIVVAAASFAKLRWESKIGIGVAVMCGLISGISAMAFYGALKNAPAGVIIPLSSLYIVITAALGYFFLGEAIGFRQIAGIALGIVAIFLLAN